MKKPLVILVVVLLIIFVIISLIQYYIDSQKNVLHSMTGDECAKNGGTIVNTLGEEGWEEKDVIGEVTDMRCECLCIKKKTNSGFFFTE